MSDLPVETAEAVPAATSAENSQAVREEPSGSVAPTDAATSKVEAEQGETNGAQDTENGEKTGEEAQSKDDAKDHSPKNKRREGSGRTHNKHEHNDRPYQKRENHSRYDPSVLPTESDPKLIRAQVEFYFGDANLPTDKFMWERTDGNSNKPIPVKDICKFGRMKRFSSEREVVNALKESGFLEVSGEEGEEVVKRKVAYDPTIPRSKVESRSVYVKGFGDEEPSSQFDIEALFAPYGPTNAVRLRRNDDKLFKGSVFVEFQDEKIAETFLALDPKPLWKGKELTIMSKRDYVNQKTKDIKDGKIQPQESWSPRKFIGGSNGRGRGGNRGKNDRGRGRDRGDRDPDDWKKRREEDQASGFKDRRSGRDRDNNNRRGRGRGDRDDRGPRDRNHERNENGIKTDTKSEETKGDEAPTDSGKPEESISNDKKRAREEDGAADAPSPKKVDNKVDESVGV